METKNKIAILCILVLFAALFLAGCPKTNPEIPAGASNASTQPPVANASIAPPITYAPYSIPSKNISLSNCSIPSEAVNFNIFPAEGGKGYSESEAFGEGNYSAAFEPGIWHNTADAPISFLGRNYTISKIHLKDCAPDEKASLKVGESISRYGYAIKLNGMNSPACEGCSPRAEILVSGNYQEKSHDLVPDTGFRFEATGLPGMAVQVQQASLPKDITRASAQIATCQEDGGSIVLLEQGTAQNNSLGLREGDSLCGYKVHFDWAILDKRFFDMDALTRILLAKQ